MKALIASVVAALALLIAPAAPATTTSHYINCGTGAYLFYVDVSWNGSNNVITTWRVQIWDNC